MIQDIHRKSLNVIQFVKGEERPPGLGGENKSSINVDVEHTAGDGVNKISITVTEFVSGKLENNLIQIKDWRVHDVKTILDMISDALINGPASGPWQTISPPACSLHPSVVKNIPKPITKEV